MLFLAFCIVTLGNSVQPVADSLVANCVPTRWHSTAFGARFVASLGVSACSIPLVGLIFDVTGGFVWLFVIMSILAVAASILAFALPKKLDVGKQGDSSISPTVITAESPV